MTTDLSWVVDDIADVVVVGGHPRAVVGVGGRWPAGLQ